MVGVDVENNRDKRVKLQKRIDIFARLANDDIALAYIAVASDKRQLSADNSRGVEAAAD